MQRRLNNGVSTLQQVKELLGDKFSFPMLIFYTDKTQELTIEQYDKLIDMGWRQEDLNSWAWGGE